MSGPRWFSDLSTAHDPHPLEDDPPTDTGPAPTDDSAGRHRRPTTTEPVNAGLSDAEMAVLASLAGYRYLTTRQIERLHYRDRSRSPLAATRAAHRAVARLRDRGLVTALDRRIGGRHAGSAGFVWRLTPTGARVAGTHSGPWRSRQPGMAHLAHTLDVAEVAVRLHERTHTSPVQIVAVEAEPACWRHYTTSQHRHTWLKPDLRITLRVPGHELHWFVEVDRGTEYRPALQRKIGRYVAAWRDGTEQARTGVFPRVAWIVPNKARADTITGICRTTRTAPEGLFVVTVRSKAIDTLTEPPR